MKFDIFRSIEVLSATPPTLRELLGSLSEEWILSGASDVVSEISDTKSGIQDRPWSPYDVLGHLIHGELTDWIPRARIILEKGTAGTFVPFDRFAQFENSKGKSIVGLLDEFSTLRAGNLDVLRSWKLSEEQLELPGTHPELGAVTLRQLLATWVVHDLNHVRQIVTIMAHKYESEVGAWKEYLSILRS
jgi:hypothetical protein